MSFGSGRPMNLARQVGKMSLTSFHEHIYFRGHDHSKRATTTSFHHLIWGRAYSLALLASAESEGYKLYAFLIEKMPDFFMRQAMKSSGSLLEIFFLAIFLASAGLNI
jgi:hypothetical protein